MKITIDDVFIRCASDGTVNYLGGVYLVQKENKDKSYFVEAWTYEVKSNPFKKPVKQCRVRKDWAVKEIDACRWVPIKDHKDNFWVKEDLELILRYIK
jgi:methenyltetrahydromethanopterin cyclohydrolase